MSVCGSVQFGHLFARGETRETAIRAMVVALKEVKIRGEIRTTVDYTADMIRSADFVGNNIHTGWLDARIATHVWPKLPVDVAAVSECLVQLAMAILFKGNVSSKLSFVFGCAHSAKVGLCVLFS